MPGLTAAQETRFRALAAAYLRDTYTRIPRVSVADDPTTTTVDESTDAWGEEAFEDGTPITGRPCSYNTSQQLVQQPDGSQVLVEVPTLLVPMGDPLAVGDAVVSVADRGGAALQSGRAIVETISPAGGGAGRILLSATLRVAKAE